MNDGKVFLDKYMTSPDFAIREVVAAYSPYKEHLVILINDKNEWVKKAVVAENPNINKEQLDALVKDKSKNIKRYATATIIKQYCVEEQKRLSRKNLLGLDRYKAVTGNKDDLYR